MKQILQNLSSGQPELIEAPAPQARSGRVLIDTSASLISTGTERMLLEFGRAGLLSKARKQPEKVRQVLEKAATDGVATTVEAVRSKLKEPIPLGYCNVGIVADGGGSAVFKPGVRVVSNGAHADVVSVPENLCAAVPDGVSDEAASFAVVASIGIQGLRLAQPTLGEVFAVTGVGLIGLLVVQLLRAQGCRVLAIDFDPKKLELARQFGAETCDLSQKEDPVALGHDMSRGAGLDGVIVTTSTKTSDPISQAAHMCRKRGRIILVGVSGLELHRADFYEKELTFQVSCSYGPGRYDPAYEEKGQDYPIGFVRWTAQRNFEAALDLLASGALTVEPLISHRLPFHDAIKAYDLLGSDKTALGIVLNYEDPPDARHIQRVDLAPTADTANPPATGRVSVGFIGAGNYASRMLIPAFKSAGADLQAISSAGGTNSVLKGRDAGFAEALSDTDALISHPKVDAVAIATRHNTHARFTVAALEAGKHVFVEKPLALTLDELAAVRKAHAAADQHLMVGFNRRFAPQVQTMKRLLDTVHEPKSFVMVMNAGAIPADHWTQDIQVGGGRIIGEACHYIDLMRFLVGAPIVSVQARRVGGDGSAVLDDKAAMILGFEDGSFGTIHYLANGGKSFPKERIEAFAAGRTLQLDNFLRLKGYNWPGFKRQNLWRQDKGQSQCAAAFLKSVQDGGAAPIPAEELFEVARVTIECAEQLRNQR